MYSTISRKRQVDRMNFLTKNQLKKLNLKTKFLEEGHLDLGPLYSVKIWQMCTYLG
jgi:hypothetical protein